MTSDEWQKNASRLRELARDPAVRSYLLGRLCAESSAADLADLVQACLGYRERFGAPSNRFGGSTAQALNTLMENERQAWTDGGRESDGQAALPDL
jgi:hypothetical protein